MLLSIAPLKVSRVVKDLNVGEVLVSPAIAVTVFGRIIDVILAFPAGILLPGSNVPSE